MKFSYISAVVLAGALLTSCGEKEFKVKGNVKDADGKTLVLSRSDASGNWVMVDSVHTKSNGDFSISFPAPASPEIFRISMGDKYIYMPVDSTETINLTTDAANFGVMFTLSGSEQAEKMAEFEKELMKLDFNNSENTEAFKREVFNKYIRDARGGILSYYVLTKTIDGKPLYDPENAADARYYAAVATSFEQYKPNDPHTEMLKNVSIAALRKRNSEAGRKHVIEAPELSMIEIELPDENGNVRKLSDEVGKGCPVVVVFSMMNEAASPEINRRLKQVVSSKGNLKIYHVCFDEDRYSWRDGARNLNWTTVYASPTDAPALLQKYNVTSLPCYYIYDSKGDLIDKTEDINELSGKL